MGIPIGWNIPQEEPKDKDILRADIHGSRSPIRRRNRQRVSPRREIIFEDDYTIGHPPFVSPGAISPSSQSRSRLPPPPVPEVSRTAYRSNERSREPPTLLREDASFRRSPLRTSVYESRMLPDDARLPALTPGFAPATASRRAEVEALREDRDFSTSSGDFLSYPRTRGVRLTRSRSPRRERRSRRSEDAEGFEDEHESNIPRAVGFPLLRGMGRRNIADGPLPASSLRESWSPMSTVDGLGDRERSMSPTTETMPWDTFLTTVVPDPVAPTAESSFASAAASASFSNSHPSSRAGSSNTSASSSRTHLTVPSLPSEQFMRACDTSDDDTASDTEAEEDTNLLPYGNNFRQDRPSQLEMRRRMRPSYFTSEPPPRESGLYSRRVLDRSQNASSYVRSFYGRSTGRPRPVRGVVSHPQVEISRWAEPNEVTFEETRDDLSADSDVISVDASRMLANDDASPSIQSPPLDQDLRDARSLLERLSRREDIGDDFWASVGLARSFADRVESFNERERL